MSTRQLTASQLDALREVGNIGAGNAVTALSEFTGRLVTLDVPEVRLVSLGDVPFLLGTPETLVVGIHVGIQGEVEGQTLLVLNAADAARLGRMLLGDMDAPEGLALSAVAETGNILASSYLGALETLTGLSAQPAVPGVAADMAGAVVSSVVAQQQEIADEALVIDACFVEQGMSLAGHFLLLPAPGTLGRLLAALGM